MRGQFPFLGIPTPERKKLSRPFIKDIGEAAVNWDFIFSLWEQPEREFQYFACEVLDNSKQALTPNDVLNMRRLAVTKSWWDTIDGLDRIVGDIALRYPEVNETLLAWMFKPAAQQQMAHIDFAVNDLEKAVQYAIHCGATIAAEQFSAPA
jgi:3-methyladenine DNA glycosylase AlkD